MRLATILDHGRQRVAVVDDRRWLPLAIPEDGFDSVRGIAVGGAASLERIGAWVRSQPKAAYRSIDAVELGPAVPDPGAIYTIGQNYRSLDEALGRRPERPLVYGKVPSSVTGHGAHLGWDRSLTANVMGECELGVVLGPDASIFGYTIVNDVTSQDPWLDGDQWLLGKSISGFCPVGPWIVTAAEIDPGDLRLGLRVNGVVVQDGRTSQMRSSIAEVVAYLGRHVTLRPGDLIATGTPSRLGPDAARYLQAPDVMTAWIQGVGELSNTID